jgi:hypothetical protein
MESRAHHSLFSPLNNLPGEFEERLSLHARPFTKIEIQGLA